jgi:hypothetical protein
MDNYLRFNGGQHAIRQIKTDFSHGGEANEFLRFV